MAGDWIKIENVTPEKPEVLRISEELGIDLDAVLGKLLRLWIWADNQTIVGNAPSVTESVIDRITGAPGFAKAMQKFGWLRLSDTGAEFPNFDRHNGSTAKTRALTKRRVEKNRNGSVTLDALPEGEGDSSVPQKNLRGRGDEEPPPPASREICRLARLFEKGYDGPTLRQGEALRQFQPLVAAGIPLSEIESAISDESRDPAEYPRVLAKRVRDKHKADPLAGYRKGKDSS